MRTLVADGLGDALHITRTQWAAALGTGAAALTLANAGGDLDVPTVVTASSLLTLGLLAQLALNARRALSRERRLVEVGAVLRMQSALMEEIARSDAVTGVSNRRGLMDDLVPEVYRALRYRRPLSLLLLDVDHFKLVNDRYGHQFGDQVLLETASLLQGAVRTSDLVARYGGEEFVVVLPETDLASAGRVAEKLRAAIESHDFEDEDRRARVTISVGVATLSDSKIDASETARRLLGKADAAMYTAKRAGRNRVRSETDLEARRAA